VSHQRGALLTAALGFALLEPRARIAVTDDADVIPCHVGSLLQGEHRADGEQSQRDGQQLTNRRHQAHFS
jgi:hypothetical protein